MNAYERFFSALDVKIAQVLLTEKDSRPIDAAIKNLRSYDGETAQAGCAAHCQREDTVSTAELEYLSDSAERIFSDKRSTGRPPDEQSGRRRAHFADWMWKALLSRKTKKGLTSRALDERLEVIPFVEKITAELRAAAAGPSASGRGGMLSKVDAAEIAMRAGGVAVSPTARPDTLDRILCRRWCRTTFVSSIADARQETMDRLCSNVRGRVVVNAGARDCHPGGQRQSAGRRASFGLEPRFWFARCGQHRGLRSRVRPRGIANLRQRGSGCTN